jgi:hypothetical protein
MGTATGFSLNSSLFSCQHHSTAGSHSFVYRMGDTRVNDLLAAARNLNCKYIGIGMRLVL